MSCILMSFQTIYSIITIKQPIHKGMNSHGYCIVLQTSASEVAKPAQLFSYAILQTFQSL